MSCHSVRPVDRSPKAYTHGKVSTLSHITGHITRVHSITAQVNETHLYNKHPPPLQNPNHTGRFNLAHANTPPTHLNSGLHSDAELNLKRHTLELFFTKSPEVLTKFNMLKTQYVNKLNIVLAFRQVPFKKSTFLTVLFFGVAFSYFY